MPTADSWSGYNVSTKSWDFQTLLTGYNLEIEGWINFQLQGLQDIGIVSMNCSECEPASLFTALHYEPKTGWRARWSNEKDLSHPGITIRVTDANYPYTDDETDQIFAVLAPDGGAASVGTWYHSRDLTTGKISDAVWKFSVDPSTGKERAADLTGPEAKKWKTQVCRAENSPFGLSQGQSSVACKRIAKAKADISQ